MPSRAACRAAVAVGAVAIAVALTVDAGLATGILSGSARAAAAQPAAGSGNAVSSVQVQPSSGGSWTSLGQSGYGYWLAPGGAGCRTGAGPRRRAACGAGYTPSRMRAGAPGTVY